MSSKAAGEQDCQECAIPLSPQRVTVRCIPESSYAGGQVWTEQTAIGGLVSEAPHGSQAEIDGARRLAKGSEQACSILYLENVAVEKFLGGISRFQKHVYPTHQDLFERLAMGQRPEALFITCADSRIDPCLLTQTKPGELFICRVIGNIVPPYPDSIGGVSATIEYAVGVLQVPEVIVCGHTDCGVMRGALNPEALEAYPNVTAWLRYAKVEHREPEPSAEFLLALTEDNVVAQLENLRSHPAVAARLEQGDLALHGWVYHIGPGTVTAYNKASRNFETTASL